MNAKNKITSKIVVDELVSEGEFFFTKFGFELIGFLESHLSLSKPKAQEEVDNKHYH